MKEHPDWSDHKIAAEARVSGTSLSRSREYQSAAAIARGQKADLPKGYKDSATGDFDAWQDG